MPVVSGRLFSVKVGATDLPHIGRWRVSYTQEPAAYAGADTLGGVRRLCGPKRWTGEISGIGLPPSILPGDGISSSLAFIGQFATSWATTPPPAAQGVSGDIVVTSLTVQADIRNNAPLGWSIAFEGNSELTEGDVTVGLPTLAAPVCAVGASVKKADVALADVLGFALVVAERVTGYQSSSTAGVEKHVRGLRDVQATVRIAAESLAALPQVGNEDKYNFVLNSDTQFEVKYMRVMSHEAVLDRGGEGPLAFDLPLALTIADASGTLGWVKRIDGVIVTQWLP